MAEKLCSGKLRQPKNVELAAALVDIARMASSAIMDCRREAPGGGVQRIAQKSDGSPVSTADLRAHALIASCLASLSDALPIVSEENAASHAQRAAFTRFWLVDPLDGTKEYIAGQAEFTVNIALIEEGRPVVGVVAAPALGLVYAGVPGAGAWRDSGRGPEKIKVSSPSSDSPLRVIASRSHLDAATQAYLAKLGPHLFLQAGSSLKFCRIAEGAADLYPRLGATCEWDTAAAQAVLEGAGGKVACMDGSPLRYGKPAPLNPPFIAMGKGVPFEQDAAADGSRLDHPKRP